MTEEAFDFWQDHSLNYLNMALSVERREQVENPDGYGKRTGDCGDSVEFFLRVKGDRIEAVSFDIDGCMNTNASAATVAMMAHGKTLKEGWKISENDVIEYLETLQEKSHHCAELAVGAFYLALSDVQKKKKAGWI